jgi:hypothetical protein
LRISSLVVRIGPHFDGLYIIAQKRRISSLVVRIGPHFDGLYIIAQKKYDE